MSRNPAAPARYPITRIEASREEGNHTGPIFLPGGRHFTSAARRAPNLPVTTPARWTRGPKEQSLKRIQPTDFNLAYAAPHGSFPGRLLFLREDDLLAQTFDEGRLELTGEPVPVAEHLGSGITRSFFSVSANGILAHRSDGGNHTQFTWFNREGEDLGRAGPQGSYEMWLCRRMPPESPIHLEREQAASSPSWSPDGQYLAFASAQGRCVYVKKADNTAGEQKLLDKGGTKFVNGWSRDGRSV